MTINFFKGEWYVWWADGLDPIVQRGYKLVIGTGKDGATEPFVGPNGEVCVGATLLRPDGNGGWVPVHSSAGSHPLRLVDGSLYWIGVDSEEHPLRIYISVAEGETVDQQVFRSLYGTKLHGDPDQVVVWGANDNPP